MFAKLFGECLKIMEKIRPYVVSTVLLGILVEECCLDRGRGTE
jgi:hypothetical protein